jgi:outer membrane protein
MYKLLRIGVAPLAVLFFLGLGTTFGQTLKIGFVNSQEVLLGTEEGRIGLETLETLRGSKAQEFESKSKELQDLQLDFQAKQRTLNPQALTQMERSIEQKQLELRRFQEDAQADLNLRQNELLQGISDKVQGVIDDYAQQNSYAVIFMRDQTQAYVSPTLDITQEIVRLYNEKYSPQAAPASPPPAGSPQP